MGHRYRLYPTAEQELALRRHCSDARFVWNLALEQWNCWRRHLGLTPGYVEQCRQLTEARAASDWLRAGSQMVQQQALRDFDQAKQNCYAGTHRRPTWRKDGQHEGFRVVDRKAWRVRQVNRRWSQVLVPKTGWVRFRRSRPVPEAKSYRVTLDRSGRWHIAFTAIPEPIERERTGATVGIDRGVANTIATSDGEFGHAPSMTKAERARHVRLQRKMGRQQKGSGRRQRTKLAVARLRATEADRVKDWVEKTTTRLVIDYDFIAVENLKIQNMTRSAKGTVDNPGRNVGAKAGLNREIRGQRWGLFGQRLAEKCELAGVMLVKVNPVNTSRRCNACGHTERDNRKSQAVFACVACGHSAHADVNAARNILAAGQAVAARGGEALLGLPVNREPQLAPPSGVAA